MLLCYSSIIVNPLFPDQPRGQDTVLFLLFILSYVFIEWGVGGCSPEGDSTRVSGVEKHTINRINVNKQTNKQTNILIQDVST